MLLNYNSEINSYWRAKLIAYPPMYAYTKTYDIIELFYKIFIIYKKITNIAII